MTRYQSRHNNINLFRDHQRRRGAMAVLIVIILPMLFALVAFFFGVSQMQLARSELRVATDAATRAATEAVLRTGDEELAFQHAAAIAGAHTVISRPCVLERGDVVFGQSKSRVDGEWDFIEFAEPFNAARIDIQKANHTKSGPVQMLFPGFGPSSIATFKTATAGQIDHDLMLVIEAGGSMHSPDRWDGVLETIQQISIASQELPNRIRVGMVVCHNNPFVAKQLGDTDDLAKTLARVSEEIADIKLHQGRNLGDGLRLASDVLERDTSSVADQTIFFLGNGHHTKGTHPATAARLAASRKQIIHCFVFGKNADKNGDMELAAGITGGDFVEVHDFGILPDVLNRVLLNPSIVLIR